MARRWSAVLGLAVCVLAGAWAAWNHVANRRLAAAIGFIRGQGEPLLASDFVQVKVPADLNALTPLAAAGAAVEATDNAELYPPSEGDQAYPNYPPFPTYWHRLADAVVAANGPALALARQARKLPRAAWAQGPLELDTGRSPEPGFNQMRSLCQVVADAALHAHLHGDDAEALERVRDVLKLGNSVDDQGSPIARLVGIAIDSVALDRLETIAADGFRIDDKGQNGAAATSAVREVILQLVDDERWRSTRLRAILAQRAIVLQEMQVAITQTCLIRPMLKLQTVRLLDRANLIERAFEQPNWPASRDLLRSAKVAPWFAPQPRFDDLPTQPFRRSEIEIKALTDMGDDWRAEFTLLSEARVAAISLAARCFFVQHQRWPDSLSELTPDLLWAVPSSPQGNDPEFHYRVLINSSGRPRPMLWFEAGQAASQPAPENPPPTPQLGWSNDHWQWRDMSLAWYRTATTTPIDVRANSPLSH